MVRLSKVHTFLCTLIKLDRDVKIPKLVKLKTAKSWNEESDLLYGPIIRKNDLISSNDRIIKGKDQLAHPNKILHKTKVNVDKTVVNIQNSDADLKPSLITSPDDIHPVKECSHISIKKIIINENKNKNDCKNKQGKAINNKSTFVDVNKPKPKRKIAKSKITDKITKTIINDGDDDEREEDDLYDYEEASPEDLSLILAKKFLPTNPGFPESSKFKSHGNETFDNDVRKLVFGNILKVPLFNHSMSKDLIKWDNIPPPSVSLILKTTMSDENKRILEEWEKRMIASMGPEQFEFYKSDLFKNGNILHSCVKNFLEGQMSVSIPSSIEGYWNSVQHVLDDIEDIVGLEVPVQNKSLHYKGILDGISVYKGKLCLIEWKTSKKLKPSLDKTFDNPLQLVAYLAAFNEQLVLPNFINYKQKISKLNLNNNYVENCLLVITYEDGSKADVHFINRELCEKYWDNWLQRVHKYWSVVNKDVLN